MHMSCEHGVAVGTHEHAFLCVGYPPTPALATGKTTEKQLSAWAPTSTKVPAVCTWGVEHGSSSLHKLASCILSPENKKGPQQQPSTVCQHATSCAHRSASSFGAVSMWCHCPGNHVFSAHPPPRARWGALGASTLVCEVPRSVNSLGAKCRRPISTMSDTRPSHTYTVPHGRSVPSHRAGKTRSFE